MMTKAMRHGAFVLFLGVSLAGCDKSEEKKDLAPESASLEEEKPAQGTTTYAVSMEESKVSFVMDAELEKISGKAPKSTSGTLSVDLSDLSKTTGLFKIDLMDLSVYQQKRESADDEFGEKVKNEKQNEHMRTWLQISEDGPQAERAANRYAEFKITSVQPAKDMTAMDGAKRKANLEVSGTLRLHGRTTKHTFPAEATFEFAGDEPKSVRVASKEPIEVALERHDVKPRKAFNVLADKTLAAMGAKVAKIAEVSIEVVAEAK